jgi:PAS domain S-box-containing protein
MDSTKRPPGNFDTILPGIVYRCKNDESWTMLYLSDKSVDLLGYTLEEVNKITYNKIINEEFRESIRETINNALDKKEAFKIIYSVTSKNGALLWFEEHGSGIFTGPNKGCIEGYIHDITEQNEYKKEHKKELKRLERAENLGLTGNWEFNLNSNKVYTSKGARTIYELEDKAYTIEFIKQIPLAKYRKPLNKALKQLINGTKPYHIQFEIKGRKSGEIKFLESIAQFERKTNKVYGVIKDITDKKLLQAKIEKTNTSYKTLYDNIPVGIATFSTDGTLLIINDEAAKNLGGTPKELLGKKLWHFSNKEIADVIFKRIQECATLKKKLVFKASMTLHGKYYTFQSYYTPVVFSNEDEINTVQITTTNITELEKTKNNFQNLTQRLSIANQAVNNGVWDWNLKTDALYWDDLMYDIYGVTKCDASFNYQNWENALVEEDLEVAKQKINKAINSKGTLDFQFRINHPQKGIRQIRAFAKYIELDEPHLIGVNYDNTERVENNIKLSQSEELFRNIFEQNNDIIALLSTDGKILKMNQMGMLVFGLEHTDITKYSFSDFTISQKDEEHSIDVVRKLNNKQTVPSYHKQFKVRDNRIRDFEISLSAIYDNNGNLQQIVTILKDISQRIIQENEILRQSKKAKEGDRLKSAFLMNMSHEIRTPLNAIIGFTEILKDTKLTSTQHGFIERVQQGGDRLINTVEEILNASLLQQNQLTITVERHNLIEILKNTYNNSKKLYANELNKIELIYACDCENDIFINTDLVRLTKIFQELINNAFKFTKSGSIILECVVAKKSIEVNIKDTGSGIKQEKLDAIFDFFRQGDEALTRGYEGLGLGLPIAKGILNLLGYAIEINTEPGIGTNITVTIPFDDAAEGFKFELPEEKTAIPDSPPNILIVEDDVHSSLFLEIVLASFSNKIDIAPDGHSCKNLIQKQAYDIAFVDLKLPDLSGFDLIPAIRSKFPECKIYIQSAFASQTEIEKAINLGAVDYLTKPVKKDKLVQIVKNYMSGKK